MTKPRTPTIRSLFATLALLAPAACMGARGDQGGALPFKVAVIPFDVAVIPSAPAAKDDGDTLEPRFEPASFTDSVREALRAQFADAVVLPPPPGVTIEEFRRLPRAEQDAWWLRACAAADADLVLECDVKVPTTAHYSHNEKFWLNLPLFLIGGPFCYFVNDTTYEGEARLTAALHQVLPIAAGRATLANGYAEVARCEVKFDGVSLDFLDRAEWSSVIASLVIPPGLLAMSNSRVSNRVAEEVGSGLAAGLARELASASAAILKTDRLADFYLKQDVVAVASGGVVRVEGEIAVRSDNAADMREYVIIYGGRRVTRSLRTAEPDLLLSTDRDRRSRIPFSETLPREGGIDRVRIELVEGGREQIGRTFTVPVTEGVGRVAD